MARAAKPGSGWVKMSDVAGRAGVSTMTVSRAFHQPDRVSPETRARIAEAAAALGYVPNLVAGNLSSSRTRIIAALVPSLANSNFASTVRGLTDLLRVKGYQLLLADCGYAPEEEARVIATVLGRRPDGLVVTGVDHSDAARTAMRNAAIPVVETWELAEPTIDMAVGFSNYAAARQMTRHMIDRGRRRIGYIDFQAPTVRRFTERRRGHFDALAEAGLAVDLIVTPGPSSGTGFELGRRGLVELMACDPGLDAILCSTDIQAVGAMFECQRRGWHIPERLAVAGFGDFEIAAEIPPGLTTVRTNGYEIGRTTAEMILARIDGRPAGSRLRDIGFEIVVRGSS